MSFIKYCTWGSIACLLTIFTEALSLAGETNDNNYTDLAQCMSPMFTEEVRDRILCDTTVNKFACAGAVAGGAFATHEILSSLSSRPSANKSLPQNNRLSPEERLVREHLRQTEIVYRFSEKITGREWLDADPLSDIFEQPSYTGDNMIERVNGRLKIKNPHSYNRRYAWEEIAWRNSNEIHKNPEVMAELKKNQFWQTYETLSEERHQLLRDKAKLMNVKKTMSLDSPGNRTGWKPIDEYVKRAAYHLGSDNEMEHPSVRDSLHSTYEKLSNHKYYARSKRMGYPVIGKSAIELAAMDGRENFMKLIDNTLADIETKLTELKLKIQQARSNLFTSLQQKYRPLATINSTNKPIENIAAGKKAAGRLQGFRYAGGAALAAIGVLAFNYQTILDAGAAIRKCNDAKKLTADAWQYIHFDAHCNMFMSDEQILDLVALEKEEQKKLLAENPVICSNLKKRNEQIRQDQEAARPLIEIKRPCTDGKLVTTITINNHRYTQTYQQNSDGTLTVIGAIFPDDTNPENVNRQDESYLLTVDRDGNLAHLQVKMADWHDNLQNNMQTPMELKDFYRTNKGKVSVLTEHDRKLINTGSGLTAKLAFTMGEQVWAAQRVLGKINNICPMANQSSDAGSLGVPAFVQ